MNHIYLERHDAKQNMHRFYQLFVMPGLFDDWSLVKEWGRVGSPGTVRKEWFTTEQEAELASQKLSIKKIKKGYCLKGADVKF
jgi:predicted DNA-binding WGR domain protein